MINPNKEIYDVLLVSISPNMYINPSISLEDNIKNTLLDKNTILSHRILVQEAAKPDEFKEIITGKTFQGCIIYKKNINPFWWKWQSTNKNLTSPILIKPIICDKLEKGINPRKKTYDTFFNKVTTNYLKDYLKIHQDKERFLEELNNVCKKADEYYHIAMNKNKKIKRLIKEYNQK